ncbi:hypothetical protein Kpol_1010p26 [Vanderwaltozyma polyspora DSM 70294]|uniref:BHLH domain-containing protein n=1 Tax=Vanderwaltozyma polyspora (strain ATCC 22028 / DSM 70294 / BCRC 21397 / CBS 2163 / NBRC 10782 / NRRL Y-8283 / UCD 57-17) TaxID=436907 RepID=A7TIH3_VANPO|nr:uncharacterized protein Kpol_1010p26 [Vanderwaltozyma polyspora DSM 70294]EDO17911.1 hypothetical protein Kpol_1010p26 [Vanderwaltozyma polyspora DSM 70294]
MNNRDQDQEFLEELLRQSRTSMPKDENDMVNVHILGQHGIFQEQNSHPNQNNDVINNNSNNINLINNNRNMNDEDAYMDDYGNMPHQVPNNTINNGNNDNYPNQQHNVGMTQFLDDIFASGELDLSGAGPFDARSGNHHQNSISYDTDSNHMPALTELPQDFLFNQRDELQYNYPDEFSSSFSSSLNSDALSSSYSSSVPYQQPFVGPPTSQSNTSNYLNSIRSPSNSLRAGNYLSSSLRQNSNMMTPNSVASPSTRHASVSNQDSMNMVSGGTPKSLAHLTIDERLKRKREFHNAVERRRRELIKEKIKELGKLVPPSLLHYDSAGKKVKANKGTILNKTVEYISYLQEILEVQDKKKEKLIRKIKELEENTIPGNMNNRNEFNESGRTAPDLSANVGTKNDPFANDRIIDTRSGVIKNEFTGNNTYKGSPGSNYEGKNFEDDQLNSELKEFLLGAMIEAEDNAKLMFNNGKNEGTPTDLLLEFE